MRDPLTEKEKDLLPYLLLEIPLKDIARKFGVKEPGIKFHITNIYKKYGVTTRKQLIDTFTPTPPKPLLPLPQGSSKVKP